MNNGAVLFSPADLIFPRFALYYVREHFTDKQPVLWNKEKFKNIRAAQFCF